MNNENLKPVNTLPPFKRLCMSIGELPSSYLETMSYYEMLVWFTEYMKNTVIPTINNNAEAVSELQENYIILKNYVDNYFDNLDVQQEINNKLDEMVEDGTLQEIITSYLNSKAVFGYDNVSSMKESTNLINGSYAKTLGFYEKNDGGNALYKIREITNSDIVDEKFIIAIGSGLLIAELITDDLINICQVGGQQNFSSVCNYLLNQGKSIYIPKRDFTATSTIIINQDNTEFICDGNIELTTENSTLFSIRNQRAIVKFNGTLTCPTNSNGIEICGGANTVRYLNLYVHYLSESKNGIVINPDDSVGMSACQITFDRINATEKGILIQPGDIGTSFVNGNTFTGGQLSAPYPIVTRKGANQTDRFNQLSFNNIICSGRESTIRIQCALDLQFMQKDWFNEMRMSEDFVGDYWIKLDNCGFVHIENFSYIDLSKILITNSWGLSYPNYFKGSYIRDNADHWLSSECYEINGKFILTPGKIFNDALSSLEAPDNSTQFVQPLFYNNKMIVKIGASNTGVDLTYTLPEAIERRGVTEFYLLVTNKDTTSKFTIKDSGNTSRLILNTGSSLTNKLYYCEIAGKNMGNSIAPTWKFTEVNLINI